MLTLEMLKAMPPMTKFATGEARDLPSGLNMTGRGQLLRWVACRGQAPDWAIYCLPVGQTNSLGLGDTSLDTTLQIVHDQGQKVMAENHIRALVPCDDKAYVNYRR